MPVKSAQLLTGHASGLQYTGRLLGLHQPRQLACISSSHSS